MEHKITYSIADTQESFSLAKQLIQAYITELQEDLSAQNIDVELTSLDQLYGPPGGALILAFMDNQLTPAGCVAIKKQDNDIAEIKRLYALPAYRGTGLGKGLLNEAISTAKSLGYQKVRLDSLKKLNSAIRLYKASDFYPIEPYWNNPLPDVVYMEREV